MKGLGKLRSYLGSDEPERQRVRRDEVNAPHDVQNPTTFPDEATPSLGERLKRNSTKVLTHSFLVIAGAAVIAVMIHRYAPGLLHSWWTTRFLPAAIAVLIVFAMGAKWALGRLRSHDWLVLRYPLTIKLYLGEYDTTDDGTRCFKPVRGFTMLGGRGHHYELGEVSEKLAQSAAKRGRSAQDPVKMELPGDEKAAPVVDTWFGKVGHVVTDGVVPNTTHPEIDFLITNSSNDHETVVDALVERLRKKDSKIDELEDRLDTALEQRDHYRDEAKKTYQEVRQDFKDDTVDIMIATKNPSQLRNQEQQTPSVSPGTNGNGSSDDWVPKELEDDIDA